MISLRNFVKEDIAVLKRRKYQDKTDAEIQSLIDRWNTGNFRGKYFIVFAIVSDEQVVGMISLYQRAEGIVTLGPEIFREFRRKEFGKEAMSAMIGIVKGMGYRIISQQVRLDNLPSILLHKGLGFQTDGSVYSNRNGKRVLIYLMAL